MRNLALLAFLLSTQQLLAQTVTAVSFVVDPPVVTSQTPVIVRGWGVAIDCAPQTARVARAGKTTTITWLPQGSCIHPGLPIRVRWQPNVNVGMLEPGRNEIILRLESRPDILGRVEVDVLDGDAPIRINPPAIRTSGGTLSLDIPSAIVTTLSMTVTIGEVTIPFSWGEKITAPPHATGAVDVQVKIGEKTYSLPAALRYFDPDAAPDETVFERFLVPVVYSGPGAFGSEWRTNAGFTSLSTPVTFATNVSKPACTAPCANDMAPAFRRFPLDGFGQHSPGLLLFLQRSETADLHFYANVRDVSRRDENWGAEIPIVRESAFVRGRIFFPAVPLDSRFRQTLRIYGVDGVAADVSLSAGSQVRTISLMSSCTAKPCRTNEPAFASLDLAATFPELVGTEPVAVAVDPLRWQDASRYWAMISLTNDETQQVTIITPQ
jgi:hypothetical protein